MRQVLQIILGGLPEHLSFCVDSVKSFAKKSNVSYLCIDNVEDDYIVREAIGPHQPSNVYLQLRTYSDLMRLKILSTQPETLYVDWDVYLYNDFVIPEEETFAFPPECVIYNGLNTDRYRNLYNDVKDTEWFGGQNIWTDLYPALKKDANVKYFDRELYRHFHECSHFSEKKNFND